MTANMIWPPHPYLLPLYTYPLLLPLIFSAKAPGKAHSHLRAFAMAFPSERSSVLLDAHYQNLTASSPSSLLICPCLNKPTLITLLVPVLNTLPHPTFSIPLILPYFQHTVYLIISST